jgi:hypothetical protein
MVSGVDPSIESVRFSNHGRPGLVSPGVGRIASIERHRPWCVSLCVAQSFIAVRRWSGNNVGPVTTVPSRLVGPMRKSAEGAFRKGHDPRTTRPRMRSAPQALGSHPPRPACSSISGSRLVPGCGRRPTGAVRHPSSHDTEHSPARRPGPDANPKATTLARSRSPPLLNASEKSPTGCRGAPSATSTTPRRSPERGGRRSGVDRVARW